MFITISIFINRSFMFLRTLYLLTALVFLSISSTFAYDWSQVAEEDGIMVYTKRSTPGVLPFKAEGLIQANIIDVLNVLRDYKKKNLWSPKLKAVKVHRFLKGEEYIFLNIIELPGLLQTESFF